MPGPKDWCAYNVCVYKWIYSRDPECDCLHLRDAPSPKLSFLEDVTNYILGPSPDSWCWEPTSLCGQENGLNVDHESDSTNPATGGSTWGQKTQRKNWTNSFPSCSSASWVVISGAGLWLGTSKCNHLLEFQAFCISLNSPCGGGLVNQSCLTLLRPRRL